MDMLAINECKCVVNSLANRTLMIKLIVWINNQTIYTMSKNSCSCKFENPVYVWKAIILTPIPKNQKHGLR